jgi:basic amino acid/polyamine antiporter, APA family
MARKIPSLGRFLGAPGLFAIAYGEIGSSLYFALGLTAVYALSLTPAVFLAAGFLFALAAAAYAEGGATIREPGGAASFARRAFNDLVGFIAGWAAALDYVIAISLSALFLPHYLTGAFGSPSALSGGEATAVAVGVVALVTAFRMVRRADVYAAGVVLAALDLLVQVSLAVLGLALLFNWHRLTGNINLGVQPTWNSLAFSLPVAMVAYTGLEKVGTLTGLAKDPEKTVPDSIRTSVFTVIIVYAAVATAAVSAFPAHRDPSAPAGYSSPLSTTWVNAPLLGLVDAIGKHTPHWFEVALRFGVGMTAVAILLLAIATGFSGCARLAESLGRHAALPSVFARQSRRVLAPPAALLGVGVVSAGFLIVAAFFQGEEALTLASLYSFGILIAFMLTQASIVWLRIVEPDMPRPFMMRGNVWIRGRLVPLTSVAGAVLAFAAWIVALGTHPGARVVGPLWMVAGLAVYAVVRVRNGLPLLERVQEAAPPPSDITELAEGAIVVPLERLDAISEEMMATACRLAVEAGATVVGVSAIVVPVREPLDAPRAERDREVEEVQRMAESLAADYGVRYVAVAGRTRSAGRMVVDAAVEHEAALIVVGSPYKRRLARNVQEQFFGSTVEFILRKAPCRVIVTHFPTGSVEAGALPLEPVHEH